MRTVMTVIAFAAVSMITVSTVHAEASPQTTAEATQMAKVYRDYPGYIAPVQCEPPVTGQAPAAKAAVTATPASTGSTRVDRGGVRYVSVWAGLTDTRDADPGSDVEISFDNGYGGGLAAGYDFGRARLELEGSYRNNDLDKVRTSAGDVEANEDLEVFTVLINAYADFATGGPATPYLGVGAGYARAEVDDIEDEFVAGQLAAGVLLAVSPVVSVDLGYRYLLPIDKDDLDIRQHTASVGLQFRF
ncbi:MAG: outer membrane protein [Desulfuromonadales bacterium]